MDVDEKLWTASANFHATHDEIMPPSARVSVMISVLAPKLAEGLSQSY